MNCSHARDILLEAMLVDDATSSVEVRGHLAICDACRRFEVTQRELDARLGVLLAAPALSAGFSNALLAKIDREPLPAEPTFGWREVVPDIAHVLGFGGLIAAAWIALPAHATYVVPGLVMLGVMTQLLLTMVKTAMEPVAS